nr:MAG TPA: hypothetical protein [Caudoviricetes sp.]DAY60368.1 MAG TPA: hypothetical protein [Caudoviricetes sp.]
MVQPVRFLQIVRYTVLSCPTVPVFFNYFDGSCLFFTRSICYPAA